MFDSWGISPRLRKSSPPTPRKNFFKSLRQVKENARLSQHARLQGYVSFDQWKEAERKEATKKGEDEAQNAGLLIKELYFCSSGQLYISKTMLANSTNYMISTISTSFITSAKIDIFYLIDVGDPRRLKGCDSQRK